MGVLRWVEHSLTDLTFFEEAAESSSLFLVLLDEVLHLPYFDIKPSTSFCLLSPTQIAVCHKLQHRFILDLLQRLIEGSYPMLEVHVQVGRSSWLSELVLVPHLVCHPLSPLPAGAEAESGG